MTETRGNEHIFEGINIKFIEKVRILILIEKVYTESLDVFKLFVETIVASENYLAKMIFFLGQWGDICNIGWY